MEPTRFATTKQDRFKVRSTSIHHGLSKDATAGVALPGLSKTTSSSRSSFFKTFF